MDTLNTLLAGENEAAAIDGSRYDYNSEKIFAKPKSVSVTIRAPYRHRSLTESDDTGTDTDHIDLPLPRPRHMHRRHSDDQVEIESCAENCSADEQDLRPERRGRQRIPAHDQRTIFVANLAERTTHKDITEVIRGGRLLDIFLRNDRSATVSFVEGAADFLAFVKRNDVYLHGKRVSSNGPSDECSI